MALYMDIHRGVEGLTAAGAAEGHQKDLEVQGKYGVEYLHYWLNEAEARSFVCARLRAKKRLRPYIVRPTAASQMRSLKSRRANNQYSFDSNQKELAKSRGYKRPRSCGADLPRPGCAHRRLVLSQSKSRILRRGENRFCIVQQGRPSGTLVRCASLQQSLAALLQDFFHLRRDRSP